MFLLCKFVIRQVMKHQIKNRFISKYVWSYKGESNIVITNVEDGTRELFRLDSLIIHKDLISNALEELLIPGKYFCRSQLLELLRMAG